MPSSHYNALSRRLSQLRAHLLPASFSPTNVYSDAELDRARAFRVLAHAEIENYLEQRALGIAEAAFKKWRTSLRPTKPLVSFLANIAGDHQGLPKKLGTNESVTTIAGRALGQFKHAILCNNGVRTENVLKLLLPIGLMETEVDPSWISTIDGFGVKRGAAAHSAAVSYSINPQDDDNTVNLVLAGLKDLDEKITKIMRSIR